MRRSVYVIASLGLLFELIGFLGRPPTPAALLLPLHGLIALVGAFLFARADPRARAVPAVLIIAAVSLSVADLWSLRRPAPELDDPDAIRVVVERDASTVVLAFERFLAGERAVVQSVPTAVFDATADRWQTFARLASLQDANGRKGEELVITVYEPNAAALAWIGTPSILDEHDLQLAVPGTAIQIVRRQPLGTTLVTMRTLTEGGRCVVGESLLDALYDPEAWRRDVPLPASMHTDLSVEFLERRQADAALAEFFKEGGDRYWTRGSQGGAELLVPVRDSSGAPLVLLTLRPESPASVAAREARSVGIPPTLVLAGVTILLVALTLVSARRWGLGLTEAIALAILTVCLRVSALALLPFLPPTPALDYRLFSLSAPFHLMASPADSLLTCLGALVLAGLLASFLRGGSHVARGTAIVSGLILGGSLLLMTPAWVRESSLNLARSPFTSPFAPRLCLIGAHMAIALAAMLLIATAATPAKRPLPFRALSALWAAASVVSYLLLARAAARVPPVLVQANLAPDVLKASEERHDRLVKTMRDASEDPRWEAVEFGDPAAVHRLALDAWRASDLGRAGMRSAFAVMNTDGTVLASFAYGLPDSVFSDITRRGPTQLPSPDQDPLLSQDTLTYLSLKVPLLRADAPLQRDGHPIGRLTGLISTEWDNLPFLTLSDPLLRVLGAGHQDLGANEYFGGAPLFLAFSKTGEVLFPSSEQAAPLSMKDLPVTKARWTTTRFAGSPYRIYLFPTPEGPRAIGYAAPATLSVTAGVVRASIGNLYLLMLLLGASAFLRIADLRRILSLSTIGAFITGSYYRRLLTVVLVSSLLPLLLLAVTFRNVIERQAREAFEQEGVEAVGTLRRLLEDYVESREGQESRVPIRSKTLFWLGRTVHQDIHVFIEDRLVATSRGDPEAAGLPGFRLNAKVAREIARNRSPQILAEEPLAGRKEALVYAPVRLREGWPDTVLAAPLILQDRDLGRGAETVSDALLTATVGLGILLSGVGYLFARRLSIPIRELGQGARRIAEGALDVRVRPRGRDEVRNLVDAFNGMVVALGQQREDLRRRKDYIEAILLNVTTGVISTSPDGLVRTSNPAAALLLDLPPGLTGRPLLEELARKSELAPLREIWAKSLDGPPSAIPREITVVRAGREVRLRSVVLPLAESEDMPAGRIFLVEDVTDVMRSNRLEAWADMARRIAHEIKNPLTPIQLSAEHLLRVRSDDSPGYDRILRECVETILGQVRALREISSDFSTYSRLPDLRREPSELSAVVHATLAPYRSSPPNGIRIVETIEAVPVASLDTRVLRRALVNLIENAFHAMEQGGVLTVTLRLLRGGATPQAEIVVEDTGIGMDETTRARLFEPYFSTRDTGIGLGLAIARRAVEEHGGTLTAESEPGRGTRMIVRLPLVVDPEESEKPAPASRESAAGESE